MGADIDPSGDLADSGTSAIAEAKTKFGPISGKFGVELDSSGCLSGGPELELGPIKITPDDVKVKADIEVEVGETAAKAARAGVQAKVAAKVCGKLPF